MAAQKLNFREGLPEQLVPAFAPLSKTSRKLFEHGDQQATTSSEAYDLLTMGGPGAQIVSEAESNVAVLKKPSVFTNVFPDSRKAYLARAKALGFCAQTCTEFFSEPGLVRQIAIRSKLLIRLGFDKSSELSFLKQVWPVYLKRENFNSMPSIIQISIHEIDELARYVKDQLLKNIDEGFESGQFAFRRLNGEPIPRPSFPQFWEHKSVFMPDSGRLRTRPVHKLGRCYQFYLNNPGSSSNYSTYFGPRIMLSRMKLEALVKVLEEIKAECEPLDEM